MEEDVNIDSSERAAAWAHRKLTKRNIPPSFQKITIDPNHPNAPFGSFDVGDSIYITAPDYPWYGDISGFHKVTSITYKDGDPTMDIGVLVQGAFDYDPIEYDPDYASQPTVDTSVLYNGYFAQSLAGWHSTKGQWIRVTDIGYDVGNLGLSNLCSVRIDHDDHGEAFVSAKAPVTPGNLYTIQGAVRWQETTSGATDMFMLQGYGYLQGGLVDTYDFAGYINPSGAHAFYILQTTDWVCPDNIDQLAIQLTVTDGVNAGTSFWSSIRVVPQT
jgi:hypothetical protein